MKELFINDAQAALIARLAAALGRPQADILDEALHVFAREREEHGQWLKAQATSLAKVWDNDDDAIYDCL